MTDEGWGLALAGTVCAGWKPAPQLQLYHESRYMPGGVRV